jgi:hypothetical protein
VQLELQDGRGLRCNLASEQPGGRVAGQWAVRCSRITVSMEKQLGGNQHQGIAK